jgi:hypothetical protein
MKKKEKCKMKNYTVQSALTKVRGLVSIEGKLIKVTGQVGLTTLGALDFLNNHCGYNVVYPIGR